MSTSLVTGVPRGSSTRRRIPASDLETIVLDRLRKFLTNQAEILDAFGVDVGHSAPQRRLLERARQIADELGSQAPEKIKATLTTMVRRIEIRPDSVQIGVSRSRLSALLAAQSADRPMRDDNPTDQRDDLHILIAQAKLKRVGREMKMLVDRDNDCAADPSLWAASRSFGLDSLQQAASLLREATPKRSAKRSSA